MAGKASQVGRQAYRDTVDTVINNVGLNIATGHDSHLPTPLVTFFGSLHSSRLSVLNRVHDMRTYHIMLCHLLNQKDI